MAILGKKKTTEKKVAAKKPAAPKASAAKAEKKSSAKRTTEQKSAFAYDVIVSPVFTEKADRAQARGTYTFYVDVKAGKVQVADAVRALYGVSPVAVRMINVRGKSVHFGKTFGTRKDRKKALVTLKSGDSIAVME